MKSYECVVDITKDGKTETNKKNISIMETVKECVLEMGYDVVVDCCNQKRINSFKGKMKRGTSEVEEKKRQVFIKLDDLIKEGLLSEEKALEISGLERGV